MKRWLNGLGIAFATLFVLVATLRPGGTDVAEGWSVNLTSGDNALAELIQNLCLFIPLGVFLTLAGVRPLAAIGLSALLSFGVEFTQQYIPGRDPSVGDIICNTASGAIGVALVRYAPHWLLVSPRRSAWQALGMAIAAVLIWYGTGAAVRPIFPPPPLYPVTAPDFNHWGRYFGEVVSARFTRGVLSVLAVAPARPPGRAAPLAAILDAHDTKAVILAMDARDLSLSYHMPAVEWTLIQPDLRWRGAFARIAPGDTFTAATGHEPGHVCLLLNRVEHCGIGYTIGDGWKLIYYPERVRRWGWELVVMNAVWVFACVVGVGFWAARTAVENGTVRDGKRRYGTVRVRIAVAIAIVGLIVVPWITGLNGTSLTEWIGALLGIEAGLVLGSKSLKLETTSQLGVLASDLGT
jgi:hypothetical protein